MNCPYCGQRCIKGNCACGWRFDDVTGEEWFERSREVPDEDPFNDVCDPGFLDNPGEQ